MHIFEQIQDNWEVLWEKIKMNKLYHYKGCYTESIKAQRTKLVNFIQKELRPELNKTDFEDTNNSISSRVLNEGANAYLFLRFCSNYPFSSGYEFLESLAITEEQRQTLIDDAVYKIHDSHNDDILRNMSKLQEDNKLNNWYNGYSQIGVPYLDDNNGLIYEIFSSARKGSVTTQFFGDTYDPNKIEKKIWYRVRIFPPYYYQGNLTLEIEKVSMKLTTTSTYLVQNLDSTDLDDERRFVVFNFSKPESAIEIFLSRDLSILDTYTNAYLGRVPGFNLKWSFDLDYPNRKFATKAFYNQFKRLANIVSKSYSVSSLWQAVKKVRKAYEFKSDCSKGTISASELKNVVKAVGIQVGMDEDYHYSIYDYDEDERISRKNLETAFEMSVLNVFIEIVFEMCVLNLYLKCVC